MADEDYVSAAKARLAKPKTETRRTGSVAARAEVLLPEIAAARAAGKTWEEIASDMSDGAPLNRDAVRIAYDRAVKVDAVAVRSVASPVSSTGVLEAAQAPTCTASTVALDPHDDPFGPMFDARDEAGRSGPVVCGKDKV